MGQEPETERAIRLRKRSNGWELWLPDLMKFMQEPRRGPQPKRKKENLWQVLHRCDTLRGDDVSQRLWG
jgi:hypothetical protein